MNRRNLALFLVVVAAGLAGGIAAALRFAPEPPVEMRAGTRLSEPRPLPEFRLLDGNGQAFTREDLAGHWSLVFFGFTHCPDVCPNTLFMLDRLTEQLSAAGKTPPQVVFVSVDPHRDSVEAVHDYVAYFNPGFIGLTATGDHDEDLRKLAGSMSVAYDVQAGDEYTVMHSSAVLLVDPQSRLHALFTPPLEAAKIAADIAPLLSN